MSELKLPELDDGRDESEGGRAVLEWKDEQKRKKNENLKKFDTSHLKLNPSLQVLLQGIKSIFWNIEGKII